MRGLSSLDMYVRALGVQRIPNYKIEWVSTSPAESLEV